MMPEEVLHPGVNAVAYHPLVGDEIRLLTIVPPGSAEEPIQCFSESVSLSDYSQEYRDWIEGRKEQTLPHKTLRLWKDHTRAASSQPDIKNEEPEPDLNFNPSWFRYSWGDYLAISYTWGSPERPKKILLNGHPFPVTTNLEAALRNVLEIAQTKNSDGPLRVWADAICINQRDPTEISHEIKRMRSIFAGALGVVIALGTGPKDIDMAFDFIRAISSSVHTGLRYAKLKEDPALYPTFKASIEPMLQLMFHDYWRRVWVIQELAVAADPVIITYGHSKLDLEQWRAVWMFMLLDIRNIELDGLLPKPWLEFHTLNDGGLVSRFDVLRSVSREIEEFNTTTFIELGLAVLSIGIMGLASNPRDQIYGLLGLLPKTIVEKTVVNYSATEGQVFTDFSKVIMETLGHIEIITLRSQKQRSKPTWVTDWTYKFDRCFLFYERRFPYNKHPLSSEALQRSLFGIDRRQLTLRADGNRAGSVTFSGSGESTKMHCQGFCIGEVDGFSLEGLVLNATVSATPFHTEQPTTTTSPYPNDKAVFEALIATLSQCPVSDCASDTAAIADIPWCGDEADSDVESHQFNPGPEFTVLLQQLMKEVPWVAAAASHLEVFGLLEMVRRSMGGFRVGGKPLKEYFAAPSPTRTLSHLTESCITDLLHITASMVARRLAVLRSGHLAAVPAVVEKGDTVWVLYGSCMPILLRKCADSELGEDCMEVIGECYVEGFMSGEGVAAMDRGQYIQQDITLC